MKHNIRIRPFIDEALDEAIALFSQGELVSIPTETVYGLAADATQDEAVAKIFALKDRPHFNPLIIHVFSLEEAEEWAEFTPEARSLAQHFWPGSLTLVLRRRVRSVSPLSLLVSAGLETVAIRCPNHPQTQKLLQRYGKPLAAPSANRFMSISPTSAEDVAASFEKSKSSLLILDGGACPVGLESTIVDMTENEPTLLRHGGVPQEAIEEFLGYHLGDAMLMEGAPLKAPGMLKRHYAPSIPLRMNATEARPGEAFLGFGKGDHYTENLSSTGDLLEAAANLFRLLRKLDDPQSYTSIAVAPIPAHHLGAAINDRLQRAAWQ